MFDLKIANLVGQVFIRKGGHDQQLAAVEESHVRISSSVDRGTA
jgi:hypothetical protein